MSCLKDNPEFKSVPLMLVSALPPEQLECKMAECGAVDVLHKPFKRADLLQRVKNLTSTRAPRQAEQSDAARVMPIEPEDAAPAMKTPSLTKACDACGKLYDEHKASCPHCARMVGRFLAQSLTVPEDAKGLLLTVLQKMESRWGLNSFASGWKLVDVGLRVVVIFVLISLAFSTSIMLQDADLSAQTKLADYRSVLRETAGPGKKASPEMEHLQNNYERLLDSAVLLVEGQTRDSWVHVWVLLGLLAFILTTSISSYRAHKESNQIRAALAFMLTSQGRTFGEQLQRRRLEEETHTMIPVQAARK
jgi:hypothetical protein